MKKWRRGMLLNKSEFANCLRFMDGFPVIFLPQIFLDAFTGVGIALKYFRAFLGPLRPLKTNGLIWKFIEDEVKTWHCFLTKLHQLMRLFVNLMPTWPDHCI